MKRIGPKIDKSALAYGMPVREQDNAYSLFIRSQPCILTGRMATDTMAIDPAHLRKFADGGTGAKPSDHFILPLRHDLHVLQHQIGELPFWRKAINHEIDGVWLGGELLMRALQAYAKQNFEDWKNGK